MPIVNIDLMEGRSVAAKRGMVAAVTDALVRALGVPPESVRILIHELDPEHFAVAGRTAGEAPLAQRGNGGINEGEMQDGR